ncbi:hypothetical protein DFJ73DRAFT_383219 [Zopfochytrium polystomum]|nr:hypothetical protein DFJ73DRAFT_383219 [Zopfochytrium polystomum]
MSLWWWLHTAAVSLFAFLRCRFGARSSPVQRGGAAFWLPFDVSASPPAHNQALPLALTVSASLAPESYRPSACVLLDKPSLVVLYPRLLQVSTRC